MSNSKNSNLEDVSKGNDESAPGANDSTSNKKTRFNKSQSISEVFRELESDEYEGNAEFSDDSDDSSVDEIIPIHNEYRDLDESDALADESVEGGIIINPDSDDLTEANVKESLDVDSIENTDPVSGETDSEEFDESIDEIEEIDDEAFIIGKDDELTDEEAEEAIGKSSAQGVLINNKDKTSDSEKSFDIFNTSTLISIVGFLVGFAIILIGITYYASSSDRVVDNVLSGETAGLAIFLVIIGFIIIGFSLLKFLSSSKSSLIIDTFNSIKSIDYDDISEDVVSREDFDAVFSIFKRKKDTNFSDNDQSVDSSKDLFEEDEDELSDDDISSLYSKSNLTSQKNQTSSKGQETANSTETSQDYDDVVDEIIPIHSKLNKQSDDSLEDKYSKYDFEEDFDDDYELVEEDFEDTSVEEEIIEEAPAEEDYEDVPVEEEIIEDAPVEAPVEAPIEEIIDDPIEEDVVNTQDFEDEADSNLEDEKMGELEDKYSKYDFDDGEDEMEETTVSKPQFKKSVDLSQFESQPLSDDELAEQKRMAQEKMLEKKRRIIEGTNFDNSLRKE